MKIDTGSKNRRDATFLAARISSQILECLDTAAPSFWDMYDSEGTRLQFQIEEIVRKATREFIDEWHGKSDLRSTQAME